LPPRKCKYIFQQLTSEEAQANFSEIINGTPSIAEGDSSKKCHMNVSLQKEQSSKKQMYGYNKKLHFSIMMISQLYEYISRF